MRRGWLEAAAVGLVLVGATLGGGGCATGGSGPGSGGGGGASTSTYSGPCAQDCSAIKTQPCLQVVCNTGQVLGTIGACVVIPAENGKACDDGLFCTLGDSCLEGVCKPGTKPNTCGATATACTDVSCNEETKTCSSVATNEGKDCTPVPSNPVNPCAIGGGLCKAGACVEKVSNCSTSPLAECNQVACNPNTGLCEGTPDSTKDGRSCSLSGDRCYTGRSCKAGKCEGGTPKVCAVPNLTACTVNACNPSDGACFLANAAEGTPCTAGVSTCQVGRCDVGGDCAITNLPPGTPCDDFSPCTTGDACNAGVCQGMASAGCVTHYTASFEGCLSGFQFAGGWACGTPGSYGPSAGHSGTSVLAMGLTGEYGGSLSPGTAVATSPEVDLTTATHPMLEFWSWVDTEVGYDGYQLQVSADGGPFTRVDTVDPPYAFTAGGEPLWGDESATSRTDWRRTLVDLAAFAGRRVRLRFGFRSDYGGAGDGVYIDDILVTESSSFPVVITSATALQDAAVGNLYQTRLAHRGGGDVVWSVVSGTNHSWLTLNPSTGDLSGTPTVANLGPTTVRVRAEATTNATNAAEASFTLNVLDLRFLAGFEGACPNGWTLTGDWECGRPGSPGPSTAYAGAQCLATKLTSNYSTNVAWGTSTATSPEIDLTGVAGATLTFQMDIEMNWADDGVNLKVSDDGGTTYHAVTTVTPPYNATIMGQSAWDGASDGSSYWSSWRLVTVNLDAYAGKRVRLRFDMGSQASTPYMGAYIDELRVTTR